MSASHRLENRHFEPAGLPAGSLVAERIGQVYPSLSPALRRFADFVLAQPMHVARLSIHEVSREISVSVATANRLARSLGFANYPAFRTELIRGFETVFEPVDRMKNAFARDATAQEIIVASLSEDIRNLEATVRNMSEGVCEEAVNLIVSARRTFVIGFDNSAHLAGLLANALDLYCANVRSVATTAGGSGAARQLFRFDGRDLVIAIAFPRHLRDTVELTRFAAARGARILAITDGPKSPLASLATVTLYVASGRQFATTSDAAALAMIEALAAAVARKVKGASQAIESFAEFAYPWLVTTSSPKSETTVPRPSKGRGNRGRNS